MDELTAMALRYVPGVLTVHLTTFDFESEVLTDHLTAMVLGYVSEILTDHLTATSLDYMSEVLMDQLTAMVLGYL